MAKRRCFLICTFKDGELRRRADGLLRLLRDALKDGFDIVRGDELAVSGGALVMASILKELKIPICVSPTSAFLTTTCSMTSGSDIGQIGH